MNASETLKLLSFAQMNKKRKGKEGRMSFSTSPLLSTPLLWCLPPRHRIIVPQPSGSMAVHGDLREPLVWRQENPVFHSSCELELGTEVPGTTSSEPLLPF